VLNDGVCDIAGDIPVWARCPAANGFVPWSVGNVFGCGNILARKGFVIPVEFRSTCNPEFCTGEENCV